MDLPESTEMSVYRDSLRILEHLAEEGAFTVIRRPRRARGHFVSGEVRQMATDLLDGALPDTVIQEGSYEFEGSWLSLNSAKLH
jgi:hypothetical protein